MTGKNLKAAQKELVIIRVAKADGVALNGMFFKYKAVAAETYLVISEKSLNERMATPWES